MHVLATAGHVDHGKSTLVRALTGMEPDRWAEERRRGMTIDLGYAWTDLPSGETIAFVDVPGHQRFIGNMLAGLGPAPAVMMVVAADEGWREQSTEHLAAADALGISRGLLVITRADLADPSVALAQSRERLRDTGLHGVEAVTVSGATGMGLDDLRAALELLVRSLPPPIATGRIRLWVDRSFSIRGSGTVLTGTLEAGTLRTGDDLELAGQLAGHRVGVRGLQSLGRVERRVDAVARVAVNLRGVPRQAVGRGDALLTPGAWRPVTVLDVRMARPDDDFADLPTEVVMYVGTAAVPARVRPLGGGTARLTLHRALPLQTGDRAILSDRNRHHLPRGVVVLDPEPLPLRRRGAAAARAADLIGLDGTPTAADHVRWRGAVRTADLIAWGVTGEPAAGTVRVGEWLIDADHWQRCGTALTAAVRGRVAASPNDPYLAVDAAAAAAGVPDAALVGPLAQAQRLPVTRRGIGLPGREVALGPAEAAVRELETTLQATPFLAPDRAELDRLRLGNRELATAAALGRVLRLQPDVVVLPDAPARAMRVLAALEQPFTTSQARQALSSTRRVVIPLLEHLDGRGWTERLDTDHRRVVQSTAQSRSTNSAR
jgi:selenocysteine-specific elongation factor